MVGRRCLFFWGPADQGTGGPGDRGTRGPRDHTAAGIGPRRIGICDPDESGSATPTNRDLRPRRIGICDIGISRRAGIGHLPVVLRNGNGRGFGRKLLAGKCLVPVGVFCRVARTQHDHWSSRRAAGRRNRRKSGQGRHLRRVVRYFSRSGTSPAFGLLPSRTTRGWKST